MKSDTKAALLFSIAAISGLAGCIACLTVGHSLGALAGIVVCYVGIIGAGQNMIAIAESRPLPLPDPHSPNYGPWHL